MGMLSLVGGAAEGLPGHCPPCTWEGFPAFLMCLCYDTPPPPTSFQDKQTAACVRIEGTLTYSL